LGSREGDCFCSIGDADVNSGTGPRKTKKGQLGFAASVLQQKKLRAEPFSDLAFRVQLSVNGLIPYNGLRLAAERIQNCLWWWVLPYVLHFWRPRTVPLFP
jgi:hypothetical protein